MPPLPLPVRYDIDGPYNSIYYGDHYQRMFRPWANIDGVATLLDTTGWTARMVVRERPDKTYPALLTATTENARLVTGMQNDPDFPYSIGLFLTPADTANPLLPPGFMGHYDIELTNTAGFVQTFYYGVYHVQGDVS